MKLIEDLNELKIGDWVKVYDKGERTKHFKIGEITDKWEETNHPYCFKLKVFQTNLPLSTEQLIQRIREKHKITLKELGEVTEYTHGRCNDEDRIFKLDKEEKKTLLKKIIIRELK